MCSPPLLSNKQHDEKESCLKANLWHFFGEISRVFMGRGWWGFCFPISLLFLIVFRQVDSSASSIWNLCAKIQILQHLKKFDRERISHGPYSLQIVGVHVTPKMSHQIMLIQTWFKPYSRGLNLKQVSGLFFHSKIFKGLIGHDLIHSVDYKDDF